MNSKFEWKEVDIVRTILICFLFVLFWITLSFKIPYPVSRYFSVYSPGLFLMILICYYLICRLPGHYGSLACFGLLMVFFALALSYKWTSGYSDNMVIGGLLPYKDAKNYYYGANLILNGLPMVNAGQSTERPLFPGFLSALFVLTGQNLKITLAILVQLAGIGLYLSVHQIRNVMGVAVASVYGVLMYFYIQPLVGYALSELLGFTLGCFAFILILRAAQTLKWIDLIPGLFVLMMAVSARAGAFVVFPVLIGWVGWAFRGEKRYSLKAAVFAFIVVLAGYFLVNTIYARLLGIPPGNTFGNFSYAIYGQVRGGTGWHSAIDELGTRDPSSVYSAAFQFFLENPMSLLIGFAKSYRDFFFLGDRSIFAFKFWGWNHWPNFLIWVGVMVLLVRGLIRLLKDFRSIPSYMLISGFIGVILSIPFLPPIDGGARFYASTMPFFFVIPAMGVGGIFRDSVGDRALAKGLEGDVIVAHVGAVLLTILTLVVPILTYAISQKPAHTAPACRLGERSFVMEIHQGSYIDLIKEGSQRCGYLPEVCLNDFDRNNIEKSVDDYYQLLLKRSYENTVNVRIVPAIDLIDGKFHYFYITHDRLPSLDSFELMAGCAGEVKTKNQSIYQVESILTDGS